MRKKGFTLIELLAVIVILGLLMAIAIPSVTKYITQSRKKTLTTTIGNYASALITDVNNMEYVFTATDTIYAVPVECIEVERGGNNPFGKWSPATENYWAYVLVQYDDKTSSYIYGFTFKDSAGYGIYPTTLEKLKESGSQIQTDLQFGEVASGSYYNWTSVENWNNSGFIINDNTVVMVLDKDENGICDIKKYCTGEGTNIGDLVTCGEEEFYVISTSGSTVNLFTKYRLDFNTNKQNVDSRTSTYFSRVGVYWTDNGSLKSKYGSSYPAYVYDENCNLYEGVEKYNNYLKNELHVSSARSRFITIEELVDLGCNISSRSCASAPDFVNSTYYWTGSVNGDGVYATWGGNLTYLSQGVAHGIRPVVSISMTEIEFD